MSVQPHGNQQPVPPHASTAALLIPNPKRLSWRNPFDYLRLLFWVMLRPDTLRAYRIRLTVPQRAQLKVQAATLAVMLTWLPLIGWTAVLWLLHVVDFSVNTAVIVVGVALLTWGYCLKYGRFDHSTFSNRLLFSTLMSGFGLAAMLAQVLYGGVEQMALVIGLGLAGLLIVLCALCVAMIFHLNTIEKMTGIMSLLMMGVISIVIFSTGGIKWLPIIFIISAVLWVGVTEERHGIVNHQSS